MPLRSRDMLLVERVLVLLQADCAPQPHLIAVHLSAMKSSMQPCVLHRIACVCLTTAAEEIPQGCSGLKSIAGCLTGSLLSELSNTTSTDADITACPTPSCVTPQATSLTCAEAARLTGLAANCQI